MSKDGDMGRIIGVVTTGIYCHPTCRSIRRSKPENVIDLREPIEGFRPCEVCRPA